MNKREQWPLLAALSDEQFDVLSETELRDVTESYRIGGTSACLEKAGRLAGPKIREARRAAACDASSGATFRSRFALGDRVVLAGDTDLVMIVSGITWRREAPEVEVTWVHAGDIRTKWLSPDLLTIAPDHLRRSA